MSVHVHIERLVMDGVAADGADGIGRGLERELARLLREGGLSHALRRGGAVPSVRGGDLVRRGDAHPETVGTNIAAAVYAGIGVGK